ncbi:helix-hairpin-helix domain-containing protein [Flavobacterium sp. SUN052]|uniref:helix-hairpin-helix domain-containing protein n=1 Tax=Flavobacterium sp. SUN052 TaxID=3002441 RepID=UPI00237E4649|nr:helix-hairpin-helix domain-containing protein [Flavobacterium sp. SUN052]MEC4004786.1 helix-hairpin-helix domain-containing protein [Flavobacterium sp. SUN052]
MQEDNNPFKTILTFSKDQRKGILLLFAIIIGLQVAYYFVDFNSSEKQTPEEQNWLSLQANIDTLKTQKSKTTYTIYPFNPNFITDFKGYKLGMKTEEINKLLAFRKQGKFANSPEEFQNVTGISDSLLNAISPYFKFPDWVTNKNNGNYNSKYPKSNWKEYPKKEALKVLDINQATKEDLMKISGIGDAISDRILIQKESYTGFVSMDQMNDIWGLSPEVLASLNKYFKISTLPKVKKININNASIKELGQFPYFKYPISKNIVTYRSMNGDLKIEDLANIKGFPVDKIKIIALYLEF